MVPRKAAEGKPLASVDPENDEVAEESVESVDDVTSLRSAKVDRWLGIGMWVVLVALVGVAASFGYSVWAQNQAERATSPAYAIIDAAQAAVDKTPNDAALRIQLAKALGAAGKSDEARAQLAAALKLKKDDPDAYQTLAQIELLEKNYDKAEVALKKLLDITATGDDAQYATVNKRREFAYYSLGEIALLSKRYEIAVNYLKEAIRVRRDASDTYVRLAQAYVALGEEAQAVKQLQIALQYDPKFPEANYELGKILLKQGKRADAAWAFRKAIDGAPEQPEPQDALASIGTFEQWFKTAQEAEGAGKLDEAIEAIDIARAMDPENYDAAMLDGQLLERKANFVAAVDAYKAALEAKPGDKAAEVALARVEKAVKASATKDKK